MRALIYLLFFVPALLAAEIYKTVDENGRVIFTDKPTVEAQEVNVDTSINNADGLSDSAYSKAGDIKSKKPVKQKSVVMYSTSWCGYCAKARTHMKSKGIKFKEYDIEKSASANNKYKKLGGSGVPFFVVDGQTMGGYNPSKLEAMIK
ncbi:MAG: glutaredoxin family protein [Pseudomonadota bacterium]